MNILSALFFPRILEFLERAKRQTWTRNKGFYLFFWTRLSKSQLISLFCSSSSPWTINHQSSTHWPASLSGLFYHPEVIGKTRDSWSLIIDYSPGPIPFFFVLLLVNIRLILNDCPWLLTFWSSIGWELSFCISQGKLSGKIFRIS